VVNVKTVTILRQKTKKLRLTDWKLKSIALIAKLIQVIKKPNKQLV
jgi:hypothetical protein